MTSLNRSKSFDSSTRPMAICLLGLYAVLRGVRCGLHLKFKFSKAELEEVRKEG